MARTIGVMASDHISVGLVEDRRIAGKVHISEGLHSMGPEALAQEIYQQILRVCDSAGMEPSAATAVGVGFPGIIRDGVVEDSPNVQQAKGMHLKNALSMVLSGKECDAPVLILNDADATSAGIAAMRGSLEKLVRVWTLGNGIGFGRYPRAEGVWECGHMAVTLDPKEQYCGCGGVGHLEGIMGHRAMRLRFLDMEPDEVFASARLGDARCLAFAKMWHRALAAATANVIHVDGAGKFYITGPNSAFVDTTLLNQYLHEMVKMSPLQGSVFEVVPTSDEIAVLGAAVSAEFAASA